MNMPSGSPQEKEMKALVADFEKETGVTVNLTTATTTYEADLKVKMASGDLPDVFATHGWSVTRYAPFLTPLENEEWASRMNPSLDKVMFDEEGHLYALPLEFGMSGLLVNYDLLDEVGVDTDTLTTWDAVESAMAKVKDAGKIPITAAGKEANSGDIANFTASGAYTTDQLETFLDGTFDTSLWEDGVTNRIESWAEKRYFNPDYVSATLDDMSRQFADGSAAFALSWPFVLGTAMEYNADANLGFIPIPGVEGQYLVGGEGVQAFGVAKDSKNPEAALAFLDFLAQPANATALMEATGAYSGLTDVEVDLGALQKSYDQWVASGKIPTMPFFDRVYLPSGMWDTIITTTDGVINLQLTSTAAAEQMQAQFTTLFTQQ